MTYTETDVVASIERLSGQTLAALTQNQPGRLDQFHAGDRRRSSGCCPICDSHAG